MKTTSVTKTKIEESNEVLEIAKFFGFKPTNSPSITREDISNTKNFDERFFPEERAAILRSYLDEKWAAAPQPIRFYMDRPFSGSQIKKKSATLEGSLVTLNSFKSANECLSIQACLAILNAVGYKDLEVELNSIGDKESVSEFQKKLTLFIKKSISEFPADLRQAVKKDPFVLFRESKPEWQKSLTECPKSIDFLSETSRLHFKEVLEFLEIMSIPYNFNTNLIGDTQTGSETVFNILTEDKKVLASGFRFNRMAKKIGQKKELGCTILNINAKLKKPLKKLKSKNQKPELCLVQFGTEARLQSFLVLRELFRAKTPIIHMVDKDRLGDQMVVADRSGATHIILIGQKEAFDNSVVIRNTTTRAQEVVLISDLAQKIKSLVK